MRDNSKLKRLAEACGDLHWRAIQENWCEWAIRDDHAYIAIMRTKSAKHPGPCPDRESKAKFLCAVTPAVVLGLIADNEINAEKFKEWQASHHANYCMAADERDQLKAENEKLKSACSRADQIICDESKAAAFARARDNLLEADLEKLKAENEALRKDADRYRWLRTNEFNIGSYHPEGEHNHKSWFENFDDESIDLAISYESEFSAEAMGKGDQP